MVVNVALSSPGNDRMLATWKLPPEGMGNRSVFIAMLLLVQIEELMKKNLPDALGPGRLRESEFGNAYASEHYNASGVICLRRCLASREYISPRSEFMPYMLSLVPPGPGRAPFQIYSALCRVVGTSLATAISMTILRVNRSGCSAGSLCDPRVASPQHARALCVLSVHD